MMVTEFIILGFGDFQGIGSLALLGVWHCLPSHHIWESSPHGPSEHSVGTPDTNVLLSGKPLMLRGLLYIKHCAQDAAGLIEKEQSDLQAGCVMQLYFFGAPGSTECYLLAVMSGCLPALALSNTDAWNHMYVVSN